MTVEKQENTRLCVRNTILCMCSLIFCIVYLCSRRSHPSEWWLTGFALAIFIPLWIVFNPIHYEEVKEDEGRPYLKKLIPIIHTYNRYLNVLFCLVLIVPWPPIIYFYSIPLLPFIALHFYAGCILPWREMRRQS